MPAVAPCDDSQYRFTSFASRIYHSFLFILQIFKGPNYNAQLDRSSLPPINIRRINKNELVNTTREMT